MSVRCAAKIINAQRQILVGFYIHSNRKCSIYPGYIFKQKRISLNEQSVLLPGNERIRASKLLDNPYECVQQIPGSPNMKTVFEVLHHGLEVSGDGDCIGTKTKTGEYKWLRYSEVISKSQCIGSALIQLGLKPCNESRVGIFGANREEFLLTMYGCSAYSMVLVPLYTSLGRESVFFIMNQEDALKYTNARSDEFRRRLLQHEADLPVVIIDTVENALKVLENVENFPSLHTVVLMDQITPQLTQAARKGKIQLLTYSELEALGKAHMKDLILPKPDDLFCIPYTSGTTGTPKGVMITHRSMIAYIGAIVMAYGEAIHYGGTIISYLPPAHIYELVNDVVSLFFARRIALYNGDVKKLMEEVRNLKPTVLPLVPRLMNAIYMNVMEKVKGNLFKSLLLKIAMMRKEKLIKSGKVTDRTIWDTLVFKDFQNTLGGNVRVITTTSAPASVEIMRFFRGASGAYIFEAYGQSEVYAATKTLLEEYSGDHVGPPLPNNHIKLVDVPEMGYFAKDDIGEVCIKGPTVFKGYFKNEEATKECLKDGWQHTGDVGKWLPNGALTIIDRKKHIFKLSQGEYISPEKVEKIYSQSNLVQQIFVDGFSDQNYAIALVVPEVEGLKKWLETKGYKDTQDLVKLLSNKVVKKEFLLELRQIGLREDLNSLEQVKNVTFLMEPFTIENDLQTPTFKVKRNKVRKQFQNVFKQLYEEGPLL